nr:type II toxin-antitoxin system YhaV family toxin [Sphingopyxis indica]
MVVNGWQIVAHSLFLDQLDKLDTAVARARKKNPKTWRTNANAKLLAALRKLVFEIIPEDPARQEYRQGNTLDEDRKHWFRAKFGAGRFRLFFRYSTKTRIIVFAWVNDETTLCTYGSKSDAYAVFRKMLDKGNPPDDWAALLAAAPSPEALSRLASVSASSEAP